MCRRGAEHQYSSDTCSRISTREARAGSYQVTAGHRDTWRHQASRFRALWQTHSKTTSFSNILGIVPYPLKMCPESAALAVEE